MALPSPTLNTALLAVLPSRLRDRAAVLLLSRSALDTLWQLLEERSLVEAPLFPPLPFRMWSRPSLASPAESPLLGRASSPSYSPVSGHLTSLEEALYRRSVRHNAVTTIARYWRGELARCRAFYLRKAT